MKLVGLVLLVSGIVPGQTFTARLTGTITDPSGNAVPNAKVTALNAEQNVSWPAASGDGGELGEFRIDDRGGGGVEADWGGGSGGVLLRAPVYCPCARRRISHSSLRLCESSGRTASIPVRPMLFSR